jgi:uncharacterized membrane protein YphA (DoxX/SURF4 family)
VNPVRTTSRLLTGSTYALLGLDAWRTPGGRVGAAADTLAALRRVVPLPEDDEVLVRANAAAMTAAGTLLALGVLPRTSAAVLFGSMVPTTAAGHAYWTVQDPAVRAQQRIQFHKNMAMLGGLAAVLLDRGPGRRRSRGRSAGKASA